MRRAMWYGAVLALLGAATVYLAADYGNRHPDTMLGQCVHGCRAGATVGPVAQAGEATVEQTYEAIRKAMEHEDVVPPELHFPPADPEPLVPPCPEPAPKSGTTDDGGLLGKIVIQPDVDDPGAGKPAGGPPAGTAEESEEPPPMPPARDEEAVPPPMPRARDDQETPPPMPRADDRSAEVNQALELWRKLLDDSRSQGIDAVDEEQCLPARPDSSECREDPNYDRHYSGCPHMGGCPSCRPQAPAAERKSVPNKVEGDAEEQSAPPTPPAMPKVAPDGKSAGHGRIDTTEYRPSDGKPFDFGSFPF